MKEKKFTFKDSLGQVGSDFQIFQGALYGLMPYLLRPRPCFDVIRLNNWGDVVDLVAGASAVLDLRLVPVVGLEHLGSSLFLSRQRKSPAGKHHNSDNLGNT